ncbi:type ISP restriction/modification enzyme [Leptolyngbya sp. PCC 6406]|uniref:type ISP restriction/modification enzyme n=1 Tax=Leptolyngbya sp. PCC 6406 TaxID=1173264 RepID=UPI0002ABB714|nr:type ISP restriction/modification enzyme [Leptolyngbya sp. PCC 6406]
MRAKIFYFTLQDEQTKDGKLDWFDRARFEAIPFDHITPDQKANWINLTDNDFDSFLPLIDKKVKAEKLQKAVFQLFSAGVKTQRDEWVYDFSKEALIERMKYFVEVYDDLLENGVRRELDIKWDADLEKYLERKTKKTFEEGKIIKSCCRPYAKQYLYFDKNFNGRTYQLPNIFPSAKKANQAIWIKSGIDAPYFRLAVEHIPDVLPNGGSQCLPLYRYDENGNRIDNITDWGLTQFQIHYSDPTITKEAIFHYTYAVLHHPAYRTKYELNLKREFPRLPFYADFHQWATWGKALMDLHLNYETIEPYGLNRQDIASKEKPKAKLKADKPQGIITLDENTQLTGVPALAWDYKLGNRSALEWILDQYKEKKPKDPTIAKLFNTYKFADYKEHVIDLLQRVCTVSVKTMKIIQQMPATVEHQG